ncbi:MAG: dTDP-4-dehydrorhamnose reductase [Gammaproteobacteria bacterium]|nr:dTDP-4-dehydrorhamnose reductase [Gammaproteobacteria bacterium]
MVSRRLLVIGRSGQVGSELLSTLQPLGQVMAADFNDPVLPVDLANPASIVKTVREVKPDVIINAAAYTAVDKAEQETDKAMAINGLAPGILAEEAARLGALLVHYSTDYVYNGEQTRPFLEGDPPSPLGVYGKTKLAGDQAVQSADGLYFIFRTSWIYGLHGKNFLLTMQRLAEEREELRIVADQVGAPTWSRLIAEATAQVLTQFFSPLHAADPAALTGIYNLTSAGETSWCEFAKAIVKHSRNPPKVVPIKTEEYPAPAKRPAYSVLDNDKLAETFGIRLPAWDTALAVCLERQRR